MNQCRRTLMDGKERRQCKKQCAIIKLSCPDELIKKKIKKFFKD